VNDLRHALRALRQNRTFTITAVAALALGIGANTAIFTVVNTVILRPLPYPDSDRIVNMGRGAGDAVSEPVFTFWQQNNPGFEDLAAYHTGGRMTLNGGDGPELVDTISASRNYFGLFGSHTIVGRTFSASEDSPGGARVAVLSYGLWQRRFGGDPGLVGKSTLLGGVPHTVIGILTPGFRSEPPADVWIPLQPDPHSANQGSILTVAARLPRGITLAQANAWIAALGKGFVETRPQSFYDPKMGVAYLQQNLSGKARPALLILLGAVGLVLLIACANVANLLLARGAARQREIAVRAAVGAGRGRIVIQLPTEGLFLALAGGALGLALGSWGVRALVAFVPGDLPRLGEMAAVPALDPLVAAFTFALAAATGILFGLAPAFQLSRTNLTVALKASGSRAGASRSQGRARAALVAAEVALAVALLCGAVLLIRSFAALHR
jgi:predicted permease